MKVFARYFKDNNIGFRRDTILQFGNSWELIGSIILINPGSAVPLNKEIDKNILNELYSITGETNFWKEFSVDPTMRWIEQLFKGKYIGKDKPLNGIIQLFNLFNLRDANLNNALSQYKHSKNKNISSIEEDIKRVGDKPVYLGWGNTGKYHIDLKDKAKEVFKLLPSLPYLEPKFEDNMFCHPRYIQMAHRRNGSVITLLHNFYNQDKNYVWNGSLSDLQIKSFDVNKIFSILLENQELVKQAQISKNKDSIRLFFHDNKNNQMELVVTKTGKGYVAIRYKPKNEIIDNSIEYVSIGEELGYTTFDNYNDNRGNWLCLKYLRELNSNNEDEAANLIMEQCYTFIRKMKV